MTAIRAMFKRWQDRDDRRHHARVHGGDVRIDIDGVSMEVSNWSPGGFRVGGFRAPPPRRGTFIKGRVRVGRVSGLYTAYVLAAYEDGSIGVRFDEIDSAVFDALVKRRV